uniref:RNA silencing suppressor n=1 Tax=Kalanchoe latent virus TaxID=132477 RepID=A0A286QI55_9VIRU|nr:nucleic acid binding protein [Kalanchoe latent virus]
MQTMGETKSWKKAVIFSLYNKLPLCLCVHIMRRASSRCVGTGRSTYARRRRAISIQDHGDRVFLLSPYLQSYV